MKKIKNIIGVILLLITLPGCSIQYNIEITQDTVKEKIIVNDTVTNTRTKETIYQEYSRYIPAYINNTDATDYDSTVKDDTYEYHEKTITEVDDGYNYTYTFDYPLASYSSAIAPREAYQTRKFFLGGEYIIINTDKTNLLCNYSYFDSLTINITVDPDAYLVEYTNASSQNDNTYTWNINQNNCDDAEILLKLNVKEETQTEKETTDETFLEKYMFYIVLIIIVIIGSIIYGVFKKIKIDDEFKEED